MRHWNEHFNHNINELNKKTLDYSVFSLYFYIRTVQCTLIHTYFLGKKSMFSLYTTVILGCCLFMAQPTITSAAHSTQHSTSRATRAKKKKIRAMYIAVGSTVLMAIAIGTGVWAYRTSKKDKMVTPPTTSHATGAASDLQAPDSTQPATAQIREHPEGRPAPHTPRRATLQEDKTSTTPSVHRSPSNVRTPSSTSHKPLPPLPDSPLPDSPPPELNDGFLGSTPPHRDAGSDVSPGTEAKYIRNCLLFYQMLFGKNYYNK